MEDRQEMILDTIMYLEDAMRELRGLKDHGDMIDCVEDMVRELKGENAEIEEILNEQARRESAAMTREYWRAVV